MSYAHADDAIVLPIIDALESAGCRVWYDARIEGGSVWTDNVGNHVCACECMIAFVSRAAAESKYCKREIHLADSEDKSILPVYLDDVRLKPGIRLMLDLNQALFRSKFDSDRLLVERLLREQILEPCLSMDAKARREAIEASKVALAASGKNERGLRSALSALRELEHPGEEARKYTVLIEDRLRRLKAERGLRDALSVLRELQDADRDHDARHHAGQVEECLYWLEDERERLVQAERKHREAEETRREAEALKEEEAREEEKARRGIEVTPKDFAEYSWEELRAIADEIAAAGGDEWLGIAKRYGLVGPDGRLGGDMKAVEVGGVTRHVRILGFRHDDRADGSGKAGISFEFADVPARHRMNPGWSNMGGWEASEMRRWLNGKFLKALPEELRVRIVDVEKRTNNKGGDTQGDVSVIDGYPDKLWLLSMTEVYGRLSEHSDNVPFYPCIYDAEGIQYQLYADQGVSTTNYGLCKKVGEHSGWWLRSPDAEGSYYFHIVNSKGSWSWGLYADNVWGVSPGFCF